MILGLDNAVRGGRIDCIWRLCQCRLKPWAYEKRCPISDSSKGQRETHTKNRVGKQPNRGRHSEAE